MIAAPGAVASRPKRRRAATLSEAWAIARSRLSWLAVLAAGVASILALGFALPAAARFPTLRATAETVMTILALNAAWLVRTQFLQTRRRRELLLLGALLTLAVLEFVAYALPAVLVHSGSGFSALRPGGQLLVAALFAATALTPPGRYVTRARRPVAMAGALAALGLGAAELFGLLFRGEVFVGPGHLRTGIDRALHHPLGFAVLLVTAGLFAYAWTEFARGGRVEGNRWLMPVAGAAMLFAAASLYCLTPQAVPAGAVTPREGLRLVAFVLLLAAVVHRELSTRARTARAAAIAERRRVAQDLHDGLAQDLAFIAAYGVSLSDELGAEHPVAVAARRALAISRETITELCDMSAMPPGDALEAIAQELRDRFDIAIVVEIQPEAEISPLARDHVARIVREAIANAARHGDAHNVVVSLKRIEIGVALRICDDGCGMRRASACGAREAGFGLRNMQERAAALGGYLTVREVEAGGTELKVILP